MTGLARQLKAIDGSVSVEIEDSVKIGGQVQSIALPPALRHATVLYCMCMRLGQTGVSDWSMAFTVAPSFSVTEEGEWLKSRATAVL